MYMNFTLVVPSATVVPAELQSLGRLPGIVYPINGKITFDYIFEQYSSISSAIKVICYENAEIVHRRLSMYHDIEILDLDYLDDLAHTIRFAINDIENPVIINFADTIVLDSFPSECIDAFFYAEDFVSSMWTFFEDSNGRITKIYDKISGLAEGKGKLFVGVFMISDTKLFSYCLDKSIEEKRVDESCFFSAIRMYSEKKHFEMIYTDKWFDIGHANKYFNANLEVKTREFNHISIDKERGILRKTSDDRDKFIGEIRWYLKLPSDIEYVRPRIFCYSLEYENPFVEMEYYSYHTIHELFLHSDLLYSQWLEIFGKIRFILSDFRRYSVRGIGISSSLEKMYLVKTIQRIERIKENNSFKGFFEKSIIVNGRKYEALNKIIDILTIEIPSKLFNIDEFCIIHGDLCFANIMIDNNYSFVKVIDPRGKFGEFDIYGDFRYELAKLFHSIDGRYDYIIKDLFDLSYDLENNIIKYSIIERKRDYNLYKLFLEVFKKEIDGKLHEIELIEALLFLSMIPLHKESLEHQIVMLAVGLDILSRVVDIDV